jgi:hypothetical protein
MCERLLTNPLIEDYEIVQSVEFAGANSIGGSAGAEPPGLQADAELPGTKA